ncbi:MAG: YncE family protein [Paludibacteraceae bacterium]|nr:YncE family protein [Paludibacteraceae bacterium]
MKKLSILFLASISFLGLSTKVFAGESYKIVNKFHVSGDEKWDFLFSDDASNLLYVSHGTMVQVVDQANGKTVGTISGLNGVHGISIAPALHKGYITSGKDSSVTIFDTQNFQVIKKVIVTGKGPDAILFDSFTKRVFVFNAKSNSATVIDAASNQILSTIAFEGNPEVAVSDEQGNVYVNLENKSSIVQINATEMKVEKQWSLAPGEEPTGLALDKETHLLFSACANKLMVISDAKNGKTLSTLPIGEKPDGAAFDNKLKNAYSSNGDGTLTIIKESAKGKLAVIENFSTQKGARTIAVNQLTHHIYLPTADYETNTGDKRKLVSGSFVVLDVLPQ